MARKKGPQKPKTDFPGKRVERKKTRLLTGSALVEAMAKIIEARRKSAELAKR